MSHDPIGLQVLAPGSAPDVNRDRRSRPAPRDSVADTVARHDAHVDRHLLHRKLAVVGGHGASRRLDPATDLRVRKIEGSRSQGNVDRPAADLERGLADLGVVRVERRAPGRERDRGQDAGAQKPESRESSHVEPHSPEDVPRGADRPDYPEGRRFVAATPPTRARGRGRFPLTSRAGRIRETGRLSARDGLGSPRAP